MRNACGTRYFAAEGSLLEPEGWRPRARPSSGAVSNARACSGQSGEPTVSSLFAVADLAANLRTTGRPGGLPDRHFYVAHPRGLGSYGRLLIEVVFLRPYGCRIKIE